MKKSLCFALVILHCFSSLEASSWTSPPVTISSKGQDASDPRIGIDTAGNAVAAWIENGVVISSNFSFEGSWSEPIAVSDSQASSPSLVVDINGNATLIWIQNDLIWTSSQPSNKNWSTPISLSSSSSSSPQIAVDTSGNLIAVWVGADGIESSTKLSGGSWQATPDLLSDKGADSPQIAIGANGKAVAVWREVISSVDTIFAASKIVNGSWSSAQTISSHSYNSAYPKVAVDKNGNAIAIWYRYHASGDIYSEVVVQASSQPFGKSWTTPTDLSPPGIFNPAFLTALVTIDDYGNGIATWNNSYDGFSFSASSSISPFGKSWSQQLDFVSSNLYGYSFDLSVDPCGFATSAMMAYNSSNYSIEIYSSKLVSLAVSPCWVPGYDTLSQGAENGYPRVAASAGKDSYYKAAVWVHFDGMNNVVHSATTTGTIFFPPTNLGVTQKTNAFNIFTEFYNVLSWEPSPNPSTAGYRIFRNGQCIFSTSADVLQFEDHNRGENEPVTYGVAAFSNNYCQSSLATTSFP
ncbi:MAG: hypothetical protein HYX48_00330 [Chlamydiales bacterium]|nr:hypothetical protein [Chlamydiales bacterium]